VVTTFAVVAGVAGGGLSASVVFIVGLASLLADGLAMGVGNFLSIRSERERYDRERTLEEWEVEHIPDLERAEIEDIYRQKGFSGTTLQTIVEVITSDKQRWVDTMMQEELQLAPETRSPLKAGAVTYTAFILVGFVPLLSYVAAIFIPSVNAHTFQLSIILTGVALFATGALKTLVVDKSMLRSGIEVLLLGGAVAVVAYLVGFALKSFGL